MKRLTTLLLLASVLLAGAALAQSGALPDDARFDQTVEFSTGNGGEQLSTMVVALARSVGLTPIVDGVPDTMIQYDIGDPKPFRQVWDLVLTLNGLDFILQENDVVVVGTEASLAPLVARQAPAPEATEQAEAGDVEQRFYRVIAEPEQVVTLLSRAVPGVEAEALPGVQSVVVTATEAQHARVREVLNEFDTAAEVVELEQRVYALSNADAEELAQVLQSSDVVVSGAASADGGTDTAERGFTVVADARTNSLIVTASLPVQRSIEQLLPELDGPQQQVNVQVRIQEVNRRVVESLGIDLSMASGNFAATVLGTGLQFIFDAQQAISELNISAVLDTLESQGLSTRVDDASLTVLNNRTATMRSGGELTIVVSGGDDEAQTVDLTYGVQIDVTPRIGPDGQISMEVEAIVSDLIEATPQLVNISDREVISTITLRPGQTVLLGGLLQNAFSHNTRGIPVLSSIPVIGGLFGQTEVEDESTELLLVVTADVLD